MVFLMHVYDISIECSHTGHDYSVYDVDKVRVRAWRTHMLTHRHIHGRASKYGHTMLLTHHKLSQARTSSLALICVPMLTCGEAKGSAKSCPATDPGDRKHELRRPERRSGSDRAGQERGMRAAARLSTRTCQLSRPARAPAACSAAVPRRGGRRRCISAGRA